MNLEMSLKVISNKDIHHKNEFTAHCLSLKKKHLNE